MITPTYMRGIHMPPADVDQTSAWPYEEMPKRAYTPGPWVLLMNASGNIAVWSSRTGKHDMPRGYIAFANAKTKDAALKFTQEFASRSPERDPALRYQDGQARIFNWVSTTVSQINIASQIAQKFFAGDGDGAWNLGHSFGEAIAEAARGNQ